VKSVINPVTVTDFAPPAASESDNSASLQPCQAGHPHTVLLSEIPNSRNKDSTSAIANMNSSNPPSQQIQAEPQVLNGIQVAITIGNPLYTSDFNNCG
jgi:hypothetical protein